MSWWTELIDEPSQLVDLFTQSFGTHTYRVTSVQLEQIEGVRMNIKYFHVLEI